MQGSSTARIPIDKTRNFNVASWGGTARYAYYDPATGQVTGRIVLVSDVSGLQAALDLKAPLASPTFTGIPSGPTATAGTNTTQFATTAFVATAVANLVNSAPSILDTLGEIATALQADESTASALATTVAGKLAKASNLSDLADVPTARANLGLGSAALSASSAFVPIAQVTGGGILATGGFTLTVPATGTAALLGTANTFTQNQTVTVGGYSGILGASSAAGGGVVGGGSCFLHFGTSIFPGTSATTLNPGSVNIGRTDYPFAQICAKFGSLVASDAATASITNVLTLGHNASSGTAGNNFGTGILFTGQDSTTADQSMARVASIWTTATHAAPVSALTWSLVNGTAGTLTDVMTLTPTGLQSQVGGTQGSPAYAFGSGITNGTSTGMYIPSVNTLAFATAGSMAMWLASSVAIFGQWGVDYIIKGPSGGNGNLNRASQNLIIGSGQGTGNGAAAGIIFQNTPAGTSGTATNAYVEVGRFDQNGALGLGTAGNANASAILDIVSTTKGFLPPRMTGTQRDAISTPAEGLVIYNNSTHKLNVYTGSAWEQVTSA